MKIKKFLIAFFVVGYLALMYAIVDSGRMVKKEIVTVKQSEAQTQKADHLIRQNRLLVAELSKLKTENAILEQRNRTLSEIVSYFNR